MGRRRKTAGTSKVPVKAKVSRKSPRKLLTENVVDSDESSQNLDDSVTSPNHEVCPEDMDEEPTQNEMLQASSASIVHKKFGKLRGFVEADSESNEQLEGLPVGEEVDTTMEDVTELLWDEEVIEETVVCEGMDVEDTRSPDGSLVNDEVDSQESDNDQENTLIFGNSNETTSDYDDQELSKAAFIPHQVPAHHQVFLAEDIEITDATEKEFEPVHDQLYYCESEDNSKDADSQSSNKFSTVGAELFDSESGVSKHNIGVIAFLDNNPSSIDLHETVVSQISSAKSSQFEVDDEKNCSLESETTAEMEQILVGSMPVTLTKEKIAARSCKKLLNNEMNPTSTTYMYRRTIETVKSPVMSPLNVECSPNEDSSKSNESKDLDMDSEEVVNMEARVESYTLEALSKVYKDEATFQHLLVSNTDQQKLDSESEENSCSQLGLQLSEESIPRKPDDEETDRKQTTPTFRSRSGSTDTTGSESSSNCSSGVRRSSRIRSISVLKQRTRSRFESVGTSIDMKVADSRDSSDGNSGTETQSDKENSSMKFPTPMSILSSVSSGSSKHLENFKPVKVKSRWRRSSELEMGGNRSSDSDVAVTPPMPSCVSPHLVTPRSLTVSPQFGVVLTPILSDNLSSEIIPEVPDDEDTDTPIPPKKEPVCDYVQEVNEDKEMEERLRQFEHLKENDYLTERTICKEAKRMVCDCFLTKEEIIRSESGCGEDCLNRLLMIECGSRCTLGERCTNKHFQKHEYSTCEVFRTEKKGFGLRAIEELSSGSFIMEYVGEVLNPKEFRRRAKDYAKDKNRHYYFMALKSDSIIDATMKGNISRFINHSCDPNSETQKWTVNGELRIGFFTSRNVSAGEEITFDYQFQRYGKEAQRCYCETPMCRGWIGEDPEKENEKPERKERKEREVKKKRTEKKQTEEEFLDDIDLEEEIEKLYVTGLKNRSHTVTLCRLMVRGRDTQSQVQLLQLIQQGEPACRRLFLDYHGLKLIASWIPDSFDDNTHTLCVEILKTLAKLPIPNKTVLQDSKVLSSVEKWSSPPTGDLSPIIEQASSTTSVDLEVKLELDEQSGSKLCENEATPTSSPVESSRAMENDEDEIAVVKEEVMKDESEKKEPTIRNLASTLLSEWSTLKEVFRIPKKERIEQMKEHEREADRGYKEYLDKESSPDKQSYDRWRQRSSDYDKRDRKKLKESPETEKIRKTRFDDRGPKLSKQERRQLFAMKVAHEEEEDRRRHQHEDLWRSHEEQCIEMGLDPATTLAFDPETDQRCLFDQATHTWLPYECSAMEEEIHPADLDPILPANLQFDPNNPPNTQFDPNNPHHVQYDSNNPAHPQFGPNNSAHAPFDPNNPATSQYNSNTNPQFDPNNSVSGQYDPTSSGGPLYDPNNPPAAQYDSNNTLIPPLDPNNQSQLGPNFVMNSHPFDSNNAIPQYDPHVPVNPAVKQEITSFDSYTCENPSLPVDKIHPPLPSITGNPPLPSITDNPSPPSVTGNLPIPSITGNPPVPSITGNPPFPSTAGNPPLPSITGNPPLPSITGNPPLPSDAKHPTLPTDSNKFQDGVENQNMEGTVKLSDFLVKPMNTDVEADIVADEEIFLPTELAPMPSKWKWATDDLGRTYYYHITIRIPQWQPPWEELAEDQTSESSEESSEEEVEEDIEEEDEEGSSSSEEDEDAESEIQIKQEDEGEELDDIDKEALEDEEELDQTIELKNEELEEKDNVKEISPSVLEEDILEKLNTVEEETGEESNGEAIYSDLTEAKLIEDPIVDEEDVEDEEVDSQEQDEVSMELDEAEDSIQVPDASVDQSEPMDLEDDEDDDEDQFEDQSLQEEASKKEKRREGLVQERIISPRREEDRPEKKNYREIKEKLRRKKDQARKARAKKKRRDAKDRSSRKSEKLVAPLAADISSEVARKIKDNFRLQMAGAMVQYLNPYRKPDCKQGRINNTEDFKHLARKLTHFVMVKELKHCRSVDDLDCNDNVKHKARDFIKKYMSKFGPVYQRPSDDE